MKVLNRKWWFRIGLGVLGTFLVIQLVPYGRDHTNPPVLGEPTWDAAGNAARSPSRPVSTATATRPSGLPTLASHLARGSCSTTSMKGERS
jgi:hypothetical protein